MLEAGRRYSDAPTAGVSLGPVDTAVLARLVSDGFARYDATTVSVAGEAVAPGGFVRGGAPLGPARPSLTPDGALIDPATGGAAGAIVIVVIGQSNGAGGQAAVTDAGMSKPLSGAYMYWWDGALRVAKEPANHKLPEDWDSFLPPHGSSTPPLASPTTALAKAVHAALGSDVVVVNRAWGSCPLADWLPNPNNWLDNYTLFGRTVNDAQKITGGKAPHALVIVGHEADRPTAISDASAGTCAFKRAWAKNIDNFRSVWPGIPVFYSQLGPSSNASEPFPPMTEQEFQRQLDIGVLLGGNAVGITDSANVSAFSGWNSVGNTGANTVTKTVSPTDSGMGDVRIVWDGTTSCGVTYSINTSVNWRIRFTLSGTGIIKIITATSLSGENIATITATSTPTDYDITVDPSSLLQIVRATGGTTGDVTLAGLKLEIAKTTIDAHYCLSSQDGALDDTVHHNEESMNRMGARIGRAISWYLGDRTPKAGHPRYPFGPKVVSIANTSSTVKTITHDMPLLEQASYAGFVVYDAGVAKTISSAVLGSDKKSVVITLSSGTAGAVTVSYGEPTRTVNVTLANLVYGAANQEPALAFGPLAAT